ncbi:MAG: methyltransferase domain-containing protein [Ilumatobacteraceae bacterium]|nr:methyltransferase domain-containing protein [Ilumatobacteraceae bacterium]
MSKALSAIQGMLCCPHCAGSVKVAGSTVQCEAGHSFDIARQGYVNFLTNQTFIKNADTAEMVDARQAMHKRPFFHDLAHQISDICEDVLIDIPAFTVVEPGGGTGFYANAIVKRFDTASALSFDISTHAAKVCARQSERVASVVADVWQRWPIADNSADVVLSVFSPRNFIETERVMKPGSVLIVVTPEENHLVELRTKFNALGIERDKSEKIAKSLENFTNIHQSVLESTELLNGSAQCDSLLSGPNGHHVSAEDIQLFSQAEPITVTHCVNISVWKLG